MFHAGWEEGSFLPSPCFAAKRSLRNIASQVGSELWDMSYSPYFFNGHGFLIRDYIRYTKLQEDHNVHC